MSAEFRDKILDFTHGRDAAIGLIDAVAAHGFGVGHAWEFRGHFEAGKWYRLCASGAR